jgi:hypothetical protein
MDLLSNFSVTGLGNAGTQSYYPACEKLTTSRDFIGEEIGHSSKQDLVVR